MELRELTDQMYLLAEQILGIGEILFALGCVIGLSLWRNRKRKYKIWIFLVTGLLFAGGVQTKADVYIEGIGTANGFCRTELPVKIHVQGEDLEKIRIRQNGRTIASYGKEKCTRGLEKTFLFSVKEEETITVQAEVYYANGRTETKSISWICDTTAPKIAITGLEEAIYRENVSVRVDCWDKHLQTSVMSLKGLEQKIIPFEKEITITADDSYTLTVTAYDQYGNCTQEERKFLVNQKGSVYEWEEERRLITERNRSPVTERTIYCIRESEVTVLAEGKDYDIGYTQNGYHEYEYEYQLKNHVFRRKGFYRLICVSEDEAGNIRSNVANKEEYCPILLKNNGK